MFIPGPDISKTRVNLGGNKAAFTRQAPGKHPLSGLRKPRLRGPVSDVILGVRTPEGDIMEQPTPTAQELRFANEDRARAQAELLNRTREALSNADLPDHW
jgi:hypothetical protein